MANSLRLIANNPEHAKKLLAKTSIDPTVQAAATIRELANVSPKPDLGELRAMLRDLSEETKDGDMSMADEMLTAQALTLDMAFQELMRRAFSTTHLSSFQAMLKAALKAQRQCAMTWEAIERLNNPGPTTQIQTNVQVNAQLELPFP